MGRHGTPYAHNFTLSTQPSSVCSNVFSQTQPEFLVYSTFMGLVRINNLITVYPLIYILNLKGTVSRDFKSCVLKFKSVSNFFYGR
jgi:hypothetical protein